MKTFGIAALAVAVLSAAVAADDSEYKAKGWVKYQQEALNVSFWLPKGWKTEGRAGKRPSTEATSPDGSMTAYFVFWSDPVPTLDQLFTQAKAALKEEFDLVITGSLGEEATIDFLNAKVGAYKGLWQNEGEASATPVVLVVSANFHGATNYVTILITDEASYAANEETIGLIWGSVAPLRD